MDDILIDDYYHVHREVAFSDTDMAGLVHFARLLIYAEDAEHCVLRTLGLAIYNRDEAWPRVHVSVNYHRPIMLGCADIGMKIAYVGDTSVHWEFAIWQEDRLCCVGEYVVVHVGQDGKKKEISENTRQCLTSGFSKLISEGK